ncbi:hypothetical protein OPV22_008116 [Ensete ventricosum]|uniref:Uncharacterized protein n=1 Tax=Ensete ventricosum TaxID=4639 RepID=A0AAV8RE00_ENSVE|nr:hypothetical protein OPV22_008116 [Ensete ventricosum]
MEDARASINLDLRCRRRYQLPQPHLMTHLRLLHPLRCCRRYFRTLHRVPPPLRRFRLRFRLPMLHHHCRHSLHRLRVHRRRSRSRARVQR